MPRREGLSTHAYYNSSPECWNVYSEVLGTEYSNAALFGRVHRLTVDAYAVQHAGGIHPDKSIDIHLTGLHLVLARNVPPVQLPPIFQKIAAGVSTWPHLEPPKVEWKWTVFDVATSDDHERAVRDWSGEVWRAWSEHHDAIGTFVARFV